MATNDIALRLLADTSKATKNIESFTKDSTKALQGVEKGFKALKVVAGAAVAVFAGRTLINGISKVTDAASMQEDAVNALNTALKTSGEFSQAASLDMQRFASEIQDTTTYGDELVLSQLSLAKAFGATNEQAKQVVEAATELAAATGKSLDEATRQVSKTLGGFAGELGEVNPAIKALTQEQLKAGEAAKILIEQYGGTAASKLQNFSGIVTSMSNRFGDFLEEIGFLITKNPEVIKAVDAMKELFDELIKSVSDNQQAFSDFVSLLAGGFTQVVQWLTEALPRVIGYMATFAEVLTSINWREVAESAATFAAVWYGSKGLIFAFQNGLPLVASLASKFSLLTVGVLAVAGAVDLLRANWKKLGAAFDSLNMDVMIAKQEKLVETMREGVSIAGFQIQAPNTEGLERAQKRLEMMLKEKKDLDANFAATNWSGGILEQLGKIRDKITGINGAEIDINVPEVDVSAIDIPQAEIDKLKIGIDEKENKKEIPFFKKFISAFVAMMESPLNAWVNLIKGFDEVGTDYLDQVQKVWQRILENFSTVSGTVLEGRKGAEKLVSSGLDVAGSALGVPGLGQALSPFMMGGEAVGDMIDEFAEAIPDIVINIIEGLVTFMDRIVDALITSLIDNGGLQRIVVALVKAAPKIGFAIAFGIVGYLAGKALQAVFERLGFDLGDGLRNAFTGAVNHAMASITGGIRQLFEGLVDSIQKPLDSYLKAYNKVTEAFREAWKLFGETIRKYVVALRQFLDKIRTLPKRLWTALISAFDWFHKIVNYLGDLFDYLSGIVDFMQDTFDWFLDNLFGWAGGLGGGGGGITSALGFKTGGVVYAQNGFTPQGSDNIPVMAKRGERILSVEQNAAFEQMPVLLAQIVMLLQKEQVIKTKAEFNGRTFADIILNLSRRNERLTA